MAQSAPTIKPPQLIGNTYGTPKPSTIAQPPQPKQTATGGYTPTGAKPAPLAQAAIRQTGAVLNAPKPATAGRPAANTTGGYTPYVATPPPFTSQPIKQQISQVNAGTATPGQLGPNAAKIFAAGGTSTAQPTGAATSNPNPGLGGIALDPTDEAARQAATSTYNNLQANTLEGQYNAALAYGDPTQEAQFGVAVPNPNSALALAALRANTQQQADINARGRAGTLFSSLSLQDQANIADTQRRAQLAGFDKYQAALAKLRDALTTGYSTEQNAFTAASADERAKALAGMTTTDQAAGSAAAGTINTGTTPGKVTSGPKTSSKGAKSPKPPSTTKAKSAKTPKVSTISAGRRK